MIKIMTFQLFLQNMFSHVLTPDLFFANCMPFCENGANVLKNVNILEWNDISGRHRHDSVDLEKSCTNRR